MALRPSCWETRWAGAAGRLDPFVQQIHPAIENIDLLGSVGQDVIGGSGSNRIQGDAGEQHAVRPRRRRLGRRRDGRDVLWGGTGADQLQGGNGADLVLGEGGEDRIMAVPGTTCWMAVPAPTSSMAAAGSDTYVFGLSEAQPDRIFDFDGQNRISLLDASADDVQAIVSGPDLYIRVGGKDIAIIDQYMTHQSDWAGVLTKGGLTDMSELITGGSVVTDPTLPQPSPDVIGSAGNDILRAPSDAGHFLRGMAGDDQLFGGAGDDRLDGGKGTDTLQGGAGDDAYVLRHGDGGIDRIIDHQGKSTVEIQGIDFKDLSAWKVGGDLWLAVDTTPLGMVEDWQSDHADWSVRIGDKTVAADDLFS